MNLKRLLLPVISLLPAMSFAATYYVTPEGAGLKDGSSWENAMGIEEFCAQAANNVNGDVYNLAGGVYKPASTVVFTVATGFTMNGNADGERTIFSGDKNGNNNPDDGDANRLIRIQTNTVNGDSKNAVIIKNVDFTCVYTNTDKDTDTMGALMIDNSGDVVVESCNFYGNWAQGSQGGPAVHSYRSTVLFRNCKIRNNSANYRGGAIRLRSNANNKGYTTFESCVISGNTNYHDLGGAVFMAHGQKLNVVNSTVYGNKAAGRGAAFFFNGADGTYIRELNVIGSTIANNHITGASDGAQITSTQSANINIVNSIVVNGNEKTADFSFEGAAESDKFKFVSGGWNCVGVVADAVAEPSKEISWQSTDKLGEEYSFKAVFGENALDSDGVVKPVYFIEGATGAQTTAAVSEWGIDAKVDYLVDQLGNERVAGRVNGAYADPNLSSGIDGVSVESSVKLVALGAGRYLLDGATEPVEVYNITGRLVATSSDDTISLESMAPGMYIIKSGKKVFKVIK